MRLAAYSFALVSSTFVYLLFGAAMTASAGPDSWSPVISFYCALLIFGLFSWLHFFMPRAGAILLVLALAAMYITFPMSLLVGYIQGGTMIGPVESISPFLLVVLTTVMIVLAYRTPVKIAMKLRVFLAACPALLASYLGFYFTVRFFGLMGS